MQIHKLRGSAKIIYINYIFTSLYSNNFFFLSTYDEMENQELFTPIFQTKQFKALIIR